MRNILNFYEHIHETIIPLRTKPRVINSLEGTAPILGQRYVYHGHAFVPAKDGDVFSAIIYKDANGDGMPDIEDLSSTTATSKDLAGLMDEIGKIIDGE